MAVRESDGEFKKMEKQEFLERLQAALSGKVSADVVAEHIRYYEDYINTEVRKGRQEDEVLSGLGDPRLIAKTIVETGGGNAGYGRSSADQRQSRTSRGGRGRGEYDGHGNGEYQEYGRRERPARQVNIPGWVWLILGILIVMVILSVIFSVLTALLPILLPIVLVVFAIKLFRDWIS